MNKQLIPVEDQRDILIYAFRYTLGRMTYAPYTIITVLKQCWGELSDADKRLYQREIREAIELNKAGMDCDVQAWSEILKLEVGGE